MKAGHCTACDGVIWRGVIRPDTQEWVPLFPDPTSVYAVVETPEGLAVGMGYHAACAPPIGSPGPVTASANGRPLGPTTVVRLDPASARYTFWYSKRFGDWLHTWCTEIARDCKAPLSDFEPVWAEWDADVAALTPLQTTMPV